MNVVFRFGVRSGILWTLAVLCFPAVHAQITITSSDISAALAAGTAITTQIDTSTDMIDIGAPGSTSWNYSALVPDFSVTANSVDPDTTPYGAFFPAATHCQRMNVSGVFYVYFDLGADLQQLGSSTAGFFQQRSVKTPPETIYDLPMTFGSSWSTSLAETSTIVSPPITTTTTQVIDNSVDAYGTLTLPGGGSYPALRIRTDRRVTSGSFTSRIISYTIAAANGATATISASDTLQPNGGVISVTNISWNAPMTTDAPDPAGLPAGFALRQNYPNPFNPSTSIAFDLPGAADVRLTLYNALGEAVRTLADRNYGPGRHTVTVDLSGLPSGMYVYRMHAGAFSDARKLMLVR